MLLTNENIWLGPVYEEEFEKMSSWYLHESLVRRLDAKPYRFQTVQELKDWWDGKDAYSQRFGIRLKQGNELIGFVELDGILWNHRNAWVSIAIGEKAHWGKGYGREAMESCMRYAFLELNLNRLQLTVFSYNEPAVRLYAALGFTREGVYREFIERNGKKHDMILFGLLKSEWKDPFEGSI
ncbi:GNAT family protein [Jeotgalibacillus sp. ET6]|uniref:GNAT family N-acetyltransferase n=1 Tax=Jeotgalibacillus sp. ET6 TaxID=3037260 RepID=UPI0024183B4D|nr:GNAT family protein [Jeotgalibacillus sp. ET6]MDG5473439.1 GNAT family protein [Jeotgalibacillus sp. ET6]